MIRPIPSTRQAINAAHTPRLRMDFVLEAAGGRKLVCKRLRISTQAISVWLRNGRIPIDLAAQIEGMSGGLVTVEQLRPEVAWVRDSDGRVTHYKVQVAA